MKIYKHINNKTRIVLNYILAFFLCLFLTVFLCTISLSIGLFHKDAFLNTINQQKYYASLYEDLYESNRSMLREAGLPEELLDELISRERIYVAGKNFLQEILEGETGALDVTPYADELNRIIDQYLLDNEVILTEEAEEGIEALIETSVKLYGQGMDSKLAKTYVIYHQQFHQYFWMILGGVLVLSLLAMLGISSLHRFWSRIVRNILYGVWGAVILNGLIPLYFVLTKAWERIILFPDYYQDLVYAFVKDGVYAFAEVSLWAGVLAIVFTVILEVVSKARK